MKQTPVEWLLNEISSTTILDKEDIKLFKQAKELERQEIIMAFWNSKHSLCDENTDLLYLAEQYYKAKFKK
jgi:phosphoribosyl-ATP pyrophosphohydrolase